MAAKQTTRQTKGRRGRQGETQRKRGSRSTAAVQAGVAFQGREKKIRQKTETERKKEKKLKIVSFHAITKVYRSGEGRGKRVRSRCVVS